MAGIITSGIVKGALQFANIIVWGAFTTPAILRMLLS
jgi:hypothetical protein